MSPRYGVDVDGAEPRVEQLSTELRGVLRTLEAVDSCMEPAPVAPMESTAWAHAATAAFARGRPVASIVVGDVDRPAAVMSLLRLRGPDRFEPAGASEMYEARCRWHHEVPHR